MTASLCRQSPATESACRIELPDQATITVGDCQWLCLRRQVVTTALSAESNLYTRTCVSSPPTARRTPFHGFSTDTSPSFIATLYTYTCPSALPAATRGRPEKAVERTASLAAFQSLDSLQLQVLVQLIHVHVPVTACGSQAVTLLCCSSLLGKHVSRKANASCSGICSWAMGSLHTVAAAPLAGHPPEEHLSKATRSKAKFMKAKKTVQTPIRICLMQIGRAHV